MRRLSRPCLSAAPVSAAHADAIKRMEEDVGEHLKRPSP
jgi:hypothetical protein